MILRNVGRGRWRSISTALGIALALGVLTALLSMFDAIDVIADLQFNHVYREDVAVYFDTPRSSAAITEVAQYFEKKIGYKIREGELQKIPYLLIVGEKELEHGTVNVRSRDRGELGEMGLEAFLESVKAEREPGGAPRQAAA